MKSKLLLILFSGVSLVSAAYADCSFIFANKSQHPVTVQGYFLANGDGLNDNAWLTVEPTRQITQVRGGKSCALIFKHSSQLATRIDLKNKSGYWIANKGFLFAADRAYSHYTGDRALADDGKTITLSNAVKVTKKEFKVFICDGSIDSDDCH